MTGREVSVLSFVDGKTIKTMTSAQDHKRAGDGDTGLNTGGMGTFSSLIILGVAMLIKNIYNQVKGRGCGCCKNCSGCSNALCEDKKKNK